MASHDAPPPYRGVYINLDRSTLRRERMAAQLSRLGLSERYRRFAAVDGAMLGGGALRPGERGAFISHWRALEEAQGKGDCVHILEDDAVLSEHVSPVIQQAIVARLFDRYDLVFTDIMVNCHIGLLKFLLSAFEHVDLAAKPLRFQDLQIIDLAQQNFACMTSYVVGGKSIESVVSLYRQEMARGPSVPVDLFIRDCVHAGKIKAACLFPFVTSFDLDDLFATTIAGDAGAGANPSVAVLAALRYSFFVGRDLEKAKRLLASATQGRKPPSAHRELIVQVLDFVMSNDFREF